MPKIFCRFGNCKQFFGKTKFRPISSPGKTNIRSASSLQRLAFHEGKCVSQWYCKQHEGVRQFHSSAFLCGDAQAIKCPQFADSISEGDIRWEIAVGDSVKVDDIIAEVETDKTSIQIPSPINGVIQALLVADGDTVTSGMELCKIEAGEGGAPAAQKPAPTPEAAAPASPAVPPPTTTPKASEALGPIPTSAPPVPPVPTAPMSATPAASVKPAKAGGAPSPLAGTAAAPGGLRTEHRVKMSRMRLKIAQNLKEAQNTCAMLTTLNEIDMSNVMEMRTKYKDAFVKKHGLKLGFMSAFVKAAACALNEQPAVNAFIDEKEIVYRDYIDISVAVSTPKGLVTPVIRNAETMNFADIERTISELGEKARAGALAIEDMDGGTFTISNGGIFGSLFGTPIINLPQSAILGMHAINQRPVAVGKGIELRPMMYVALTYDHRLIDGREAVTFLKKIKDIVEDPRLVLLEL